MRMLIETANKRRTRVICLESRNVDRNILNEK